VIPTFNILSSLWKIPVEERKKKERERELIQIRICVDWKVMITSVKGDDNC
jgi:hypothetical protein